MTITIDPQLFTDIKTQKLRMLQARYIELSMDKTCYAANQMQSQADATQVEMDKTQASYDAVNAMQG